MINSNKNDTLYISFFSVFLRIGSKVDTRRMSQWKFSRWVVTQNLSRISCHILNNFPRIWHRIASERAKTCDVIWPQPTATCAAAATLTKRDEYDGLGNLFWHVLRYFKEGGFCICPTRYRAHIFQCRLCDFAKVNFFTPFKERK